MEINSYNKLAFTGYDARALKGVFVTDKISGEQLSKTLKDLNVDVYIPQITSKSIKKEYHALKESKQTLWAQDYLTILKNKVVLFDNSREHLQRVLRACSDGLTKTLKLPLKAQKMDPHLRGGNYFICDVQGKSKLLIGENKKSFLPDKYLKAFHDSEEICPIPILDYHIDLFVRPLNNGNILVTDNELTVKSLTKLKSDYEKYIVEHNINGEEKETYKKIIEQIDLHLQKFEITEEFDQYTPRKTTEKLVTTLQEYGFNPIRVPGSYYYLRPMQLEQNVNEALTNFENNMADIQNFGNKISPKAAAIAKDYITTQRILLQYSKDRIGRTVEKFYNNNFLNAIAFTNNKGKIEYVTNSALLDKDLGITPEIEAKTGLSTKNIFIESVSDYIDKENIHFINEKLTERLFEYMGGIHCTAAEIPA